MTNQHNVRTDEEQGYDHVTLAPNLSVFGDKDRAIDAQHQHVTHPRWFALADDGIVVMPRQTIPVSLLRAQAAIPRGSVIFRDHASPNDVAFGDEEIVNLAEGNVFYHREGCGCEGKSACSAPAKMALSLDDRYEITARATLTGAEILLLFGHAPGARLFRDVEGANDQPVGADEIVRFQDGPCFSTKGKPHNSGPVVVTINTVEKPIPAGTHSVADLKLLGGVPIGDELVQIVASKPHRLPNDGSVQICGGEVFISHPCRGTSS